MVATPLRTKPKSASAERCLRSLGATIDMATPDMETSNCPVRGVLSHGGLRKGNQEVAVITGFYRSPGIAERFVGKKLGRERQRSIGKPQAIEDHPGHRFARR